MKRALVTTTINVPTVLTSWARELTEEDHVIVVGDMKTPHQKVREFLDTIAATGVDTAYVHPHENTFRIEDPIGFNTIQRRNIGFLYAAARKADIIITVDDDNYPTFDWMSRITRILSEPSLTRSISSPIGWYNPGWLCEPKVTHRGYPMSLRCNADRDKSGECSSPGAGEQIGVFQSLVIGDPDIDAIERIVIDPSVNYVRTTRVMQRNTLIPFNSQATAFRAELLPLMLMWPGVGRYDDIWASYLCQIVMHHVTDLHVMVGLPAVRQTRNPHDLMRDLKDEMLGYEHTLDVVAAMQDITRGYDQHFSILAAAQDIFTQLPKMLPWLPRQTVAAFKVWLDDVRRVTIENA